MDFRSVCTTQAASALSFGVVLLVVPGWLLALLGAEVTPAVDLVARMLGGMLFALGATLIGARDVTDRASVVRISLGNATCDGAVAVFLAAGTARGTLGPLGWVLTVLFAANVLSWVMAARRR